MNYRNLEDERVIVHEVKIVSTRYFIDLKTYKLFVEMACQPRMGCRCALCQ
jgi:hypothetical protein